MRRGEVTLRVDIPRLEDGQGDRPRGPGHLQVHPGVHREWDVGRNPRGFSVLILQHGKMEPEARSTGAGEVQEGDLRPGDQQQSAAGGRGQGNPHGHADHPADPGAGGRLPGARGTTGSDAREPTGRPSRGYAHCWRRHRSSCAERRPCTPRRRHGCSSRTPRPRAWAPSWRG